MGRYDDLIGKKTNSSTTTNSRYADLVPPPKESLGKKALGIGNEILKTIVKTPLRGATNITQYGQYLAGKEETQPFSNKWLGEVKPVGQEGNFGNKLADTIGWGTELASYLPVVRGAKVGLTSSKEAFKAALPGLIGEGAFGGFAGTAGSGIQRQAGGGQKLTAKELLIGTGAGAIINPVIGVGANKAKGIIDEVAALKNMKYLPANFPRKLDVMNEGSLGSKVKVNTPISRYADYREKMGYEPYVQNGDLPVIQMGPKAKDTSGLPTIDYITGKIKPAQNIAETATNIIQKGKTDRTVVDSVLQPERARLEPVAPQQPIINAEQPQTFVPKKVQELNTVFDNKLEGLPEVERMTMADQYNKANELVNTNYEQAKNVLFGKENAPGDLRSGALLDVVVDKAKRENDWDLIKKLAQDPNSAATRVSETAQELKSFDTNTLDSTDPVGLMREVIKARERAPANKKYDLKLVKADEVKNIKSKIKPPKKDAWVDFINSIEC